MQSAEARSPAARRAWEEARGMGGEVASDRADRLALFDAHRDAAYGLARRVTDAGRDDLEDIVAEAFEEVLRAVDRGIVIASPRRFVCGVTGRICLRHLRRRSRFARALRRLVEGHSASRPPECPGMSAERAEAVDRVQTALNTLPPAWRAIVVMHHIEEIPVCEIAEELGLREGTVKSRLFRARDALRRELALYVLGGCEEEGGR